MHTANHNLSPYQLSMSPTLHYHNCICTIRCSFKCGTSAGDGVDFHANPLPARSAERLIYPTTSDSPSDGVFVLYEAKHLAEMLQMRVTVRRRCVSGNRSGRRLGPEKNATWKEAACRANGSTGDMKAILY